jgi:hypothetical protein
MPRQPRNWLPGLIPGRGFVLSNGAACSLNFAEVYPQGIMAQLRVRLVEPISIEMQRDISGEASSYLYNSPNSGPQLTAFTKISSPARTELVNHEGHIGIWTFNYWWDEEMQRASVELFFSWPERGLEASYILEEKDIAAALDQSVQLWESDASEHGYVGE